MYFDTRQSDHAITDPMLSPEERQFIERFLNKKDLLLDGKYTSTVAKCFDKYFIGLNIVRSLFERHDLEKHNRLQMIDQVQENEETI